MYYNELGGEYQVHHPHVRPGGERRGVCNGDVHLLNKARRAVMSPEDKAIYLRTGQRSAGSVPRTACLGSDSQMVAHSSQQVERCIATAHPWM
jgi:hypothetical protein